MSHECRRGRFCLVPCPGCIGEDFEERERYTRRTDVKPEYPFGTVHPVLSIAEAHRLPYADVLVVADFYIHDRLPGYPGPIPALTAGCRHDLEEWAGHWRGIQAGAPF